MKSFLILSSLCLTAITVPAQVTNIEEISVSVQDVAAENWSINLTNPPGNQFFRAFINNHVYSTGGQYLYEGVMNIYSGNSPDNITNVFFMNNFYFYNTNYIAHLTPVITINQYAIGTAPVVYHGPSTNPPVFPTF